MDLETENRIAAILLKEARELRQQADKEGALAYLREPTVRGRPNSRFLTATVRGVQQANRAVEVNEMWRLRDKQLELENRVRNRNGSARRYDDGYDSRSSSRDELESGASASRKSKKRPIEVINSASDEGLRDEDLEEFLHSRTKRGRGAIGPRMDETGPYLPSCPGSSSPDYEPRKARVLGPERPFTLKRRESSDDESDDDSSRDEKKRRSSKHRSSKHRSKSKSKDEKRKKRREEKKKKHRR